MKRATKRLVSAVLFFSLLVIPGWAQDSELARVYATEAIALYHAGEYARAAEIAERGLQFRADDSDLLVVRALVAERDPSTTGDALTYYRAAVSTDRFFAFDPVDTRVRAASLMNRTGRNQEALQAVEGALIDPLFNRDLLYEQARALFGLGRHAAAEERASAGVRIYLDDPRFFRLLLQRVPVPGYRDYLSVRRYESRSSEYLRLLSTYLERIPDSAHRRETASRYFELGGRDPAVSVLLIGSADDQQTELTRFRDLGGAEYHDLLLDLFLRLDDEAQDEIIDEFASFRGRLIVDRDRNGIAEQTLLFDDGRLVQWRVDRDQDGTADFLIEINERRPVVVEHNGAGGYSRIEYRDYPEIGRITFDEPDGGSLVYHAIGDRIELFVLAPESTERTQTQNSRVIPDALRPIELHSTFTIVDRESILRNSGFVEHFRAGADRAHRIVELEQGNPLRSVEDTTGDGTIDHVVRYIDGMPSEGMRDIVGDGTFDVIETYRDSLLSRITVVTAGERVAAYYQQFGEIETRGWDLNRDGTIDVRERYLDDLLILREYATGENSEFDLSIEFFSDILTIRDE